MTKAEKELKELKSAINHESISRVLRRVNDKCYTEMPGAERAQKQADAIIRHLLRGAVQ